MCPRVRLDTQESMFKEKGGTVACAEWLPALLRQSVPGHGRTLGQTKILMTPLMGTLVMVDTGDHRSPSFPPLPPYHLSSPPHPTFGCYSQVKTNLANNRRVLQYICITFGSVH